MPDNPYPFKGLSSAEAEESRSRHGMNSISGKGRHPIWATLVDTIKEPMLLLLVACTSIYFSIGAYSEGWFMAAAIVLVSGISLYQDAKSRRAMQSLEAYTQPNATLIRDNQLLKIPSKEIVLGDNVVVTEGELIPADGRLLQGNDLTVNESILTGEAYSVTKDASSENNLLFSGTLIASGGCVYEVTAIGINTKLGQIGKSLESIETEKTPLQLQISSFVKKMALAGAIIFLAIWLINYLRSGLVLDSLLSGLTIAMSVLPEEIPVAFATFMALGAYRLMRSGVIVKQTSTVEALGSATVLCADKTGTITENRMEVFQLYDIATGKLYDKENCQDASALKIVTAGMWASETVPFDPMEIALHQLYTTLSPTDERLAFKMIHEYPLEGKPPMMTHIFEDNNGHRIIACKGATERLLRHSTLSKEQVRSVNEAVSEFGKQGLRVLAVATTIFEGNAFPASQEEFQFNVIGLVAFYDPPKKNITQVFDTLYKAGIQIKMITGDNPETAMAIGKQVELDGYNKCISSAELLALDEAGFDKAVMGNSIFSRMFPELKFRIIESLKRQGQVVAMTGDGVNDGPALKAAHIGIAMGKRGTETAKSSASLILTDDDLGNMVDAVAMGRKIYTNLKKAIQYIISIHIPIILTVAIPSILGWVYPNIFTPVHVIFLELIMGPTCSIIYENEPPEKNSMLQPPRALSSTFFNLKELTISIVQGLGITAATIFIYQFSLRNSYGEELTRSMVFTTLIFANIFLTLVNRSFYYSVVTTLKNKNNLLTVMLLATVVLLGVILYVPPVAAFFKVGSLSAMQLGVCAMTSLLSVVGFEVYKWGKRTSVSRV
jgi:Ca2+-transporting ATPase